MLIPEIQALTGRMPVTGQETSPAKRSGFEALLRQTMQDAGNRQVNLSRHAMERAQERGIEMTPTLMDKLNDSVEKAEAKGATNILALDRSLAFIINVPNHKVITLMRQDEMKENVFTNIDGAVIL